MQKLLKTFYGLKFYQNNRLQQITRTKPVSKTLLLILLNIFILILFIPKTQAFYKEPNLIIDNHNSKTQVNLDYLYHAKDQTLKILKQNNEFSNLFVDQYANTLNPDYVPNQTSAIYHYFYGYFDQNTNTAHIIEIFSVLNSNTTHGLFVTIPLSAYIKDTQTFHVNKLELNHIGYFKFDSLTQEFTQYSVKQENYGSLAQPYAYIKIGDPDLYAPGLYLYYLDYTIHNVVEKDQNTAYLNYSLKGSQSTNEYIMDEFVTDLPQAKNSIRFYAIQNNTSQDITNQIQLINTKNNRVEYKLLFENLAKDTEITVTATYPAYIWKDNIYKKELDEYALTLKNSADKFDKVKPYFMTIAGLLVLAPVAFSIRTWSKYGKDKALDISGVEYLPSKALDELSFIAKHKLLNFEPRNLLKASSTKGISADILELIRQRFLKYYKDNKDYVLTLGENSNKTPTNPTQKQLFDYLKQTITQNNGEYRFSTGLFKRASKNPLIKISQMNKLFDLGKEELTKAGVFDKKSKQIQKKTSLILGAILIASVFFTNLPMLFDWIIFTLTGVHIPLTSFVVLFTLVIFSTMFALFINAFTLRLSDSGVALYRELKGLYRYINKAEIEKIKRFDTPDKIMDYFERLLPYAVLFNLEKKWINTFKNVFENLKDLNQNQVARLNTITSTVQDINVFTKQLNSHMQSLAKSSRSFSSGGVSLGGGGGGFSGGSGSGSW